MATLEVDGRPSRLAASAGSPGAVFAAWTVCVLSWVCGLGGLSLVVAGQTPLRNYLGAGHAEAPLIALLGGLFGALIVRARPGHPIGWLTLVNALAQGLHALANGYASLALRGPADALPGGDLASLLVTPTLVVAAATLCLHLTLFPDGRPASPRWRWLVAVILADGAISVLLTAVATLPFRGARLLDGAASPGVDGMASRVGDAARLVLGVAALLALGSLLVRYRRSRGIERQQLKWYLAGFGLAVVMLLVGRSIQGEVGGVLSAISAVPALTALYIAMRRYHLYDIDRVVSRTISYAALTVVVALTYLLAATVLAWIAAPYTGGSTLVVAASAACAAAVFTPARRYLQEVSDRAFRRRSHEAGRVMARYLETLRDRQPAAGSLRVAVAAALQDDQAEVGLWLAERGAYVDESGRPVVPGMAGPTRSWVRVDRREEHLGIIVLAKSLVENEPDVVDATIRAAALALDHARLRAQVSAQLEEVRASRARIVASGDAERRRIERDLHDGAQQRLLAAALSLRRIEAGTASGGQPSTDIGRLAGELEAAIAELREISHGLVPGILAEQGLQAAVLSLVDGLEVPVRVEAEEERRFDAEVETAAYYVVAEALANVTRHAGARHVSVTIRPTAASLVVEVSDDGAGGATLEQGSGLIGLRDRVDVAGGVFTLQSQPGHGTLVRAVFPLE